jgi:Predicted membrane protein (DUF2232)
MSLLPQSEPVATEPGRPIGQMARSVAGYSVLLSVMMVVPLTVFAPAALFDCAWRNGRRAAVIALTIASAFAALVWVRMSQMPPVGPHDLALNLGMLVTLLLSLGLPALFVLPMVQRGESFGRVLMTATVVSILGFGASELVMRTTTGTSPFETEYTVAHDNFAQVLKDNPTLPIDAQQLFRQVSAGVLYCLAAVRLISVVLTFTLSLVLYGRLRAWREFMVTREPAVAVPFVFRSLVLPEWLLFAFLIGGLSPFATGAVRHAGLNLIALVGFLYLLQGLAIFRWLIVAVGINFLGALFAYATLVLLTPMGVSPLLLSIAGLFDSFFDFRHFNRKDSTHEGHSD